MGPCRSQPGEHAAHPATHTQLDQELEVAEGLAEPKEPAHKHLKFKSISSDLEANVVKVVREPRHAGLVQTHFPLAVRPLHALGGCNRNRGQREDSIQCSDSVSSMQDAV